jgi:ATP-dependent DNA helicase DinG
LTPDLIDRAARRSRTFLEDIDFEALSEAADGLSVGLAEVPAGRITTGLPQILRDAATLLDAACRAALNRVGDVKADDPDPVRRQQAKAVLTELSTTAQRLLAEAQFDVAWVEKGDRRQALVVAPLTVAGILNTQLFPERTVVATSATLALGGKFDTVARSLGLAARPPAGPAPGAAPPGRAGRPMKQRAEAGTVGPASEQEQGEHPWRGLDVGSPFDYRRQGILYVAAHLPRPQQSGLPDVAADELVELIQALGGRTLGLFSSRRAAERAAEVARARTDLPILLQGEESLPLLVRKFREERRSCLFGVMSLWQGVDVPGEACQLVVIDRLPFPRPDEPLAAARSAAVDAAGGSGFTAVSVPIAAVRLAQGVGRLIRSHGDKGVVAVLDSRLETARGYGGYLRASLPPFWYTTKKETVLAALRRLGAPAEVSTR